MRAIVVALIVLGVGACTWPTNVGLKRTDDFQAAQAACLSGNVAQFDDGTSPPASIGRYVAMSCSVETSKLIQYVIPYANQTEREAMMLDAERRATSYVLSARAHPKS
ncbi:MAG: hypothetical protein NTV97_23225 [Alphaproteobacteria bacterium]|nr:hypothetical protein [Alphaproteobacteria bacterium]